MPRAKYVGTEERYLAGIGWVKPNETFDATEEQAAALQYNDPVNYKDADLLEEEEAVQAQAAETLAEVGEPLPAESPATDTKAETESTKPKPTGKRNKKAVIPQQG